MRRLAVFFLLLPLILGMVLIDCAQEEKAQPQKVEGEKKTFVPPEDGRITPAQAEAYVKVSLTLIGPALKEHEKAVRGLIKKHGLKEDLTELADSTFLKDHPEVIEAWNELNERWVEMEQEIYEEAGMSDEEFTWVGGALTDTINGEIQKVIAEKLSASWE